MARKETQFVVTENNAVVHEGTLHQSGTILAPEQSKGMDVERLVASGAIREASAEDHEAFIRAQAGLDPKARAPKPPAEEEPEGSTGTKEVTP